MLKKLSFLAQVIKHKQTAQPSFVGLYYYALAPCNYNTVIKTVGMSLNNKLNQQNLLHAGIICYNISSNKSLIIEIVSC